MRKVYIQMNDDINAIIDTFKLGTVYEEFLDDNHKNAITSPVDRLIDFGRFLGREDVNPHKNMLTDDVVITDLAEEKVNEDGALNEDPEESKYLLYN